ncbi:MAG: DUF4142 domain-containing protein [Ramlibacter sp.]|nr:DUF4142 domain-containing protein [Ramlibacter sp.]
MRAILLLVVAAYAATGSARAEEEADRTGVSPAAAAAEAAKPRVNSWMFAPASAALAKPMTPQQRDDRQFLRDAASAGRFESDASRLALSKSGSAGVRTYAGTLIKHHATAGNELQYLLQARGMAPPMLANHQRKTLNRLAKLQGAKFDREYLAQVGLKQQKEGVQVFERASRATQDPQIKAWIDRTLPTMRYHLASGEKLAPAGMRLAAAPANAQPRQVAFKLPPRALSSGSSTP